MLKIQKIRPLLEIGGINLLLFKLEDKFLGGRSGSDYMYKIMMNADPEDYPRLLKSMYALWGGVLHLDNPQTYNEKIQWLKLYDATPQKTRLADKYAVRDWIKGKIGEEYLVPIIGVWDSFDEINFSALPNAFALKCNHGSGWNAIISNKSDENFQEWNRMFTKWLGTNYAFVAGLELQYKNIKPKIICEKLIEENIIDYRIYCFSGIPTFIKVTQHNPKSAGGYDSALYYPDWTRCEFRMVQGYGDLNITKPKSLDELITLASILCQEFRFVRVDFYVVNDKIYFSEMTFTPNSGYERFENIQTAIRFGDMIETHHEK